MTPESALHDKDIADRDNVDTIINVRPHAPKDLEEHKQIIRQLMVAIGDELRIKMQYFSVHSNKRKEYMIDPYRLMHFRGGLYLFAFVHEYHQIRTFAVERISAIEKLNDHFEMPPDFSVESYLESAFGIVKEEPVDVEVIFGKNIAEYVRSRIWHPSQQCREIDGGRIRMKLHVGGEFELVSWILGFGASAQVISPDRLRRRVESELSRTLDNYRHEVTVAPTKERKADARKPLAAAVRKG